jgi:hypothetical protein
MRLSRSVRVGRAHRMPLRRQGSDVLILVIRKTEFSVFVKPAHKVLQESDRLAGWVIRSFVNSPLL